MLGADAGAKLVLGAETQVGLSITLRSKHPHGSLATDDPIGNFIGEIFELKE